MAERSPLIWFGAKKVQAPHVWKLLGALDAYWEPFAGSCAVLLGAPRIHSKEVINDVDAFIANFWRSVQHDPKMVLRLANRISSDIDNVSGKKELARRYDALLESCRDDFSYFDSEMAGLFLYCNANSMNPSLPKNATNTRLYISPTGSGRGWQMTRKLTNPYKDFGEWMERLATRMQKVSILCRDWRDVKDSRYLTFLNYNEDGKKTTGIYMDPPYTAESRMGISTVYGHEDFDVAGDCRQWAFDHGENPSLRIVLSGFKTEFETVPSGWHVYAAPRKAGQENFNRNKAKALPSEVLVASPNCRPLQQDLFRKVI